ncbi:MAG: 2Fe-2S iron-sulfur cluster-binding protein, partial [Bacteroidota bacterium]
GNKNSKTIVFKDELQALAEAHPRRLNVVHTLSEPYSDWSMGWGWKQRKGIIDAEAVEWFITENPPRSQRTEYYSCGPGSMNPTVKRTLQGLGVPGELIHFESFGGGGEEEAAEVAGVAAEVRVHLRGQVYEGAVPAGETLLQFLKAQEADPPYSCESGVCGTCIAKVKQGSVGMRNCMALDDSDVEAGWVLTCQGLPTSEKVEVEIR